MGKFKIEVTEDEMIRFYANKIVEDGIKDCYEFSNVIDINDYGNDIAKYKNVILERIYRDERVADVNLDEEGNLDMVFYTDVRFVVIIIDPLSFLLDNKLNNISQPSLSNETYPSSSSITKSNFSNFFLYAVSWLLLIASVISSS